MTINDLWNESVSALGGNKTRSGLTILGVVIGIASVVTLVAIGQGATAAVTSSISSLGSNLLVVTPGSSKSAGPASGGAGSATTLTKADADAIKKAVSDASVSGDISKRFQVTAKGTNTNTTVIGSETSYMTIRNITIDQGAWFSDQNNTRGSTVAVIGPTVRDDLFGTNASNVIGSTIRINQISFKVIGITQSKGGSGVANADDSIYVPLTSAQRYLAGGQASLTDISVAASSQAAIPSTEASITATLLDRHHITDPTAADFSVINQQDIASSLTTVTRTLTMLLGAIAGISLLVGGIGIMNMMLTSVTERTREIGLRKAIGAKQFAIKAQFLTEAVLLTSIGGAIGIALGWGAAIIVTKTGAATADVTWWSIVLAFGVSSVIGIIFGYYPAQRAARMKPIDALKYE